MRGGPQVTSRWDAPPLSPLGERGIPGLEMIELFHTRRVIDRLQ